MELGTMIEGVLFYKAAPMKKTQLASFFAVSAQDIDNALISLADALEKRGVQLIVTDTEAQLVTAPELNETIESLRKDELRKDIGNAGAETLAIILYRGPISRADIDRIRGVNSNFILRNLLVRGLIERRDNPNDQRSFLYAITPELLAFLGIPKREDLPEFAQIMNELDAFERQRMEDEQKQEESTVNT